MCLQQEKKHEAASVFGSEPRSTGKKKRRFGSMRVDDGALPTPSIEADPKGSEEIENRQSLNSFTYHTKLAEPILMANGLTSGLNNTDNLQSEWYMISVYMGLSERTNYRHKTSQMVQSIIYNHDNVG